MISKKLRFLALLMSVQPSIVSAQSETAADPAIEFYTSEYGVSLGEAARRLDIIRGAGDVNEQLKAKHPNQFAGLYFDHSATFRVIVKMTGGGQGLLNGITTNPAYQVVKADRPVKQSMQLVERMATALAAVKQRSEIGIDVKTDRIFVNVLDANSAKSVLADFLAKNPYIDVNQVAELMVNAVNQYGGRSLLYSPLDTATNCTSGFAATIGTQQGVLTAGHCIDTQTGYLYLNGAKHDAVARSYVDSTTQGLDMMFLSKAGDTYPNEIYVSSTAKISITSASASNPATTPICVYGMVTAKKICGTVDAEYLLVTDDHLIKGKYGRALSTGGVTFAKQGDSGGPVFNGSQAVGLIKGYVGKTLYFVNIKDISAISATVKTAP
jgi:streptogrisin C